MTPRGAQFIIEAAQYFDAHPKARQMRVQVALISEWYRNFDEVFLGALQYNLVAHVDARAGDIVLERP